MKLSQCILTMQQDKQEGISPMTMADWAEKLDAFLKFNDAEILSGKGKVTAKIAKTFAESEFEKYRIIQDTLYKSDFDKLMEESIKELEKKR